MSSLATLANWFIFDGGEVRPRHGGRYKGDDVALEKCVYFYPEDMEDHEKKTAVGCAEAMISFASMFSQEPCEVAY